MDRCTSGKTLFRYASYTWKIVFNENKKKTIKKKSFYFEDYNESELTEKNKSKIAKISFKHGSEIHFDG